MMKNEKNRLLDTGFLEDVGSVVEPQSYLPVLFGILLPIPCGKTLADLLCTDPGTKNTHRYRHRGRNYRRFGVHELLRPVRRLRRGRDLPDFPLLPKVRSAQIQIGGCEFSIDHFPTVIKISPARTE